MPKLDYITIKGFKSIESVEKLEMRSINLVIGPNGSGKSNFIGVFAFLNAIRDGKLKDYVAKADNADKILHFDSKVTPKMELHLSFEEERNQYSLELEATPKGELYRSSESVYFWGDKKTYSRPYKTSVSGRENLREAGITASANFGRRTNLVAGPLRNNIMSRLVIHVEGPTEETFVNEVLRPHLVRFGYTAVWPRIVGNARLDRRSGGIKGWASVRKDLIEHLQENRGCRATTMVDYYALPKTGGKAWPGRAAARLPYRQRAGHVENALLTDIQGRVDYQLELRFRPFVTMHEFEGLLFSDCRAFSEGIGRPELEADFQTIRDQFNSPEEINDSPHTAPSKRVEDLVSGYSKPVLGVLAALEIGLDPMRAECPIFRRWLEHLETWLDD